MQPIIFILIFIASTWIGYRFIQNVPSLLHTPLMSGMNALSGITVIGSLTATAAAVSTGSRALGFAAVFLAALNIAGGFAVTHRMLKMFRNSKEEKK